jgi:hypothetical protein
MGLLLLAIGAAPTSAGMLVTPGTSRRPSPLATAAASFVACGEHLVSAAAMLSADQQRQKESAAALSTAAAFLCNAGQCVELAAAALDAGTWEGGGGAAYELADAARDIDSAAAALAVFVHTRHLTEAAAALEAAAGCTGCISMASAAGPDLQDCGDALSSAGEMLVRSGEGMADSGATQTHHDALGQLMMAGAALAAAGREVSEAGCLLEAGWQVVG